MYNELALRPHVRPTAQLMPLIAHSRCWHFDAWMMRDTQGRLFLIYETRSGGRELLTRFEYTWENGRLRMVPALPDDLRPVTIQDRGEQQSADELNAIHSTYVLPAAARVPAGFHSRSVALHYVRCPDLPPFGGNEPNWQQ